MGSFIVIVEDRGKRRAYTDLASPTIIAAAKPPRGEGETIMVVEDDAAVRLLIAAVLEELGYRYLEASDAPKAMTILRSGARIDLLLTDVGLPIMNGRQLAEFARESRPEIKVLFVNRLRRERRGSRRPSRPRHGHVDEAVCHQCARTQN